MKMKKVLLRKEKLKEKRSTKKGRRAKDPLSPEPAVEFVCSLTEDPVSVAAPDTPAPGKEDQGWEFLTFTSRVDTMSSTVALPRCDLLCRRTKLFFLFFGSPSLRFLVPPGS